MSILDLFTPATLTEVKGVIANFAALGKLYITNWALGRPGEQLYTTFAKTMQASSVLQSAAIRGVFLDYATDPGDDDPYAPENAALAPGPGWLSALGENVFFTKRRGETVASTSVRLTNSSSNAYFIAPYALTVARAGHSDVTYKNVADPLVYTDTGGTKILFPGAHIDLQFAAESPGSAFSAAAGELTVFVSALIGVTVTNAAGAVGEDREDAPAYRQRCREQATATSPNGAADKYRYYATTQFGGDPLERNDGSGVVGITKVYVSPSSTTGVVNVYFADDDGPSDGVDVSSANDNITLQVVAPGDCITYTGAAAGAVPITVTWAVEFQIKYLGKTIAGIDVKAAIVAALTARFRAYPIGGYDQVAGVGKIYREDIRATVFSAHPAIYNASVSSPGGDVTVTLGGDAVLTTPTGTETGA